MITDEQIKQVSEKLEIEFYRNKRYATPTTVVIFDTECPHLFDTLKSHLRKTDVHEQISDTKIVLILTHTDKDGALALIEKYTKIVRTECHKKVAVGYTDVKPEDEHVIDIMRRVKASIALAKKEFMKDIIDM